MISSREVNVLILGPKPSGLKPFSSCKSQLKLLDICAVQVQQKKLNMFEVIDVL